MPFVLKNLWLGIVVGSFFASVRLLFSFLRKVFVLVNNGQTKKKVLMIDEGFFPIHLFGPCVLSIATFILRFFLAPFYGTIIVVSPNLELFCFPMFFKILEYQYNFCHLRILLCPKQSSFEVIDHRLIDRS